MNIDVLLACTGVFYQGYIVSSLLNFLFSRNFRQSKEAIQNVIGLFLLIGLSLYYFILLIDIALSWYSGTDLEYITFVSRATGSYKGMYLFMVLMPLITLAINSTKKLRTNYVVIALSCLMFFPGLYEFFLILLTSSQGVTLWTINRVYLSPVINMLFYGVVIYCISVFIVSRRRVITQASSKEVLE